MLAEAGRTKLSRATWDIPLMSTTTFMLCVSGNSGNSLVISGVSVSSIYHLSIYLSIYLIYLSIIYLSTLNTHINVQIYVWVSVYVYMVQS